MQRSDMQRYGMTIPLGGPLHAQREQIEQLAQLGYTDLWTAEANEADGLTALALASVWTPTLRLGTAILPAFTRGPALLAQSAAAMASAAPGRFRARYRFVLERDSRALERHLVREALPESSRTPSDSFEPHSAVRRSPRTTRPSR